VTANPAGYSRAAGIALVAAAVAGAASREVVHLCPPAGSGLTPCCGRPPFELPRTDRLTPDAQAATCVERRDAAGHLHCDCCGHRYAGDHVPGRPCPCFERDAWEGTR
jgi:hypothetical protein